jgi:hypothetical protein
MNKLYLLVALGLSVKADVTSSTTGIDTSSNGWYAGDCLDSTSFSGTYGFVVEDCGATCYDLAMGSDTGTDFSCDNYSAYTDCTYYSTACYYNTSTDEYYAACLKEVALCM